MSPHRYFETLLRWADEAAALSPTALRFLKQSFNAGVFDANSSVRTDAGSAVIVCKQTTWQNLVAGPEPLSTFYIVYLEVFRCFL